MNETATETVVIDDETDETELDLVRHLILATHDDVVAELIAGGTIPELMASIEPAREAHRNVVSKLAPPAPPAVPPGAALGVADPDDLPAHELIRRGLMARS